MKIPNRILHPRLYLTDRIPLRSLILLSTDTIQFATQATKDERTAGDPNEEVPNCHTPGPFRILWGDSEYGIFINIAIRSLNMNSRTY